MATQRMLLAASNPQRSPFFRPLRRNESSRFANQLQQLAPGNAGDLPVVNLSENARIRSGLQLRKDLSDKWNG